MIERRLVSQPSETVEKRLLGAAWGRVLSSVIGKMAYVSGRHGLSREQLEVVGRGGHRELFRGSGETSQLERS